MNNNPNLYPNPTISTIFLLESSLRTMAQLKTELDNKLEYRNLMSIRNKSSTQYDNLAQMCLKHTGTFCYMYSKQANKYYMIMVCLNINNELVFFHYGAGRTFGPILGDINPYPTNPKILGDSPLRNNNDNIIIYSKPDVKIIIVSERKYNAIIRKTEIKK